MPIVTENPVDELKDRHREIVTQTPGVPDEQELAEREEAAQAYAGENEQHFVDYSMDCIKTSMEACKEIRMVQDRCWRVYNEDEPETYAQKAAWQSRIVVPKPFQSVQYWAAAIKKAFSPDFLSVEDEKNERSAKFWKEVFKVQLNNTHSNFVLRFADAVTMALAVGQGLEMIPQNTPGYGLEFDLVEPWKIHRDPDCPARDPQGGMYWIHQEWIDYFILQEGEAKGKYFDVARAQATESDNTNDPFLTREAIAARKKQIWQRSQFRKLIQVSEVWGTVLSPKAEVLLDNATFTVAGGRVIQKPAAVKYKNLRWPGISFSPLPDILTHGGRGLLKGVKSIWDAMNNLMCLHEDALKWLVNPPTEINIDQLADPEDVEQWPGKKYLTINSIHGQQAVRAQNRRDVTNTVLANMQYLDQNFQRGSMSTDGIQGLPGYRKDMTWRESSQNLQQALGVYALMGANIEQGAVMALMAAKTYQEKRSSFQRLAKHSDENNRKPFRPALPVDIIDRYLCKTHLDAEFEKRSGNAANKDRKNLGAAWQWGRENLRDWPVGENPFYAVKRYPENRRPRYVPPETDFWKLEDYLEERARSGKPSDVQDHVMNMAYLHLAARKTEIFRLKRLNLDFDSDRIRLWTRKRKDGRWEYEWLPMTSKLRKALVDWMEIRLALTTDDIEHVFVGLEESTGFCTKHYGQPFRYRLHVMKRWCEAAGIDPPFGFHAIRHLTASILYKKGEPLVIIQSLLRHKSAHTTERYLRRLGFEDVRPALEKHFCRGPAEVIPFANVIPLKRKMGPG